MEMLSIAVKSMVFEMNMCPNEDECVKLPKRRIDAPFL